MKVGVKFKHYPIQLSRSGKSHPGTNQQNSVFLKAIFVELQERREDCIKLKERLERLEVRQLAINLFSERNY